VRAAGAQPRFSRRAIFVPALKMTFIALSAADPSGGIMPIWRAKPRAFRSPSGWRLHARCRCQRSRPVRTWVRGDRQCASPHLSPRQRMHVLHFASISFPQPFPRPVVRATRCVECGVTEAHLAWRESARQRSRKPFRGFPLTSVRIPPLRLQARERGGAAGLARSGRLGCAKTDSRGPVWALAFGQM
jgi:hypothetical protein